jgi:hypothetical protein
MEKDNSDFENVVKEAVQSVILFDDKVGKLIEFIIANYGCKEYIKDMNKVSRYIIKGYPEKDQEIIRQADALCGQLSKEENKVLKAESNKIWSRSYRLFHKFGKMAFGEDDYEKVYTEEKKGKKITSENELSSSNEQINTSSNEQINSSSNDQINTLSNEQPNHSSTEQTNSSEDIPPNDENIGLIGIDSSELVYDSQSQTNEINNTNNEENLRFEPVNSSNEVEINGQSQINEGNNTNNEDDLYFEPVDSSNEVEMELEPNIIVNTKRKAKPVNEKVKSKKNKQLKTNTNNNTTDEDTVVREYVASDSSVNSTTTMNMNKATSKINLVDEMEATDILQSNQSNQSQQNLNNNESSNDQGIFHYKEIFSCVDIRLIDEFDNLEDLTIFDPCTHDRGMTNISDYYKEKSCNVIERVCKLLPEKDNFKNDPDPDEEFDVLISYPPYYLYQEVLEKALSYPRNIRIVLLLPLDIIKNESIGGLLKRKSFHKDEISPNPKHFSQNRHCCTHVSKAWYYFNFTTIKSKWTFNIIHNFIVPNPDDDDDDDDNDEKEEKEHKNIVENKTPTSSKSFFRTFFNKK